MEQAKTTFTHYFRTLFEANGLKWDSDNTTEIREAMQAIYDQAVKVASENK